MSFVPPKVLSRQEGIGITAIRPVGDRILGKNGVSTRGTETRTVRPQRAMPGNRAPGWFLGCRLGTAWTLRPEQGWHRSSSQGPVRSHDGPHWEHRTFRAQGSLSQQPT